MWRNSMLIFSVLVSHWCISDHSKPQWLPTVNIYYWLWVIGVGPLVSASLSYVYTVSCDSADLGFLSWLGDGWSRVAMAQNTGFLFMWFLIFHQTSIGLSHSAGKDPWEKTESLVPSSDLDSKSKYHHFKIDPNFDETNYKVIFQMVWIYRSY